MHLLIHFFLALVFVSLSIATRAQAQQQQSDTPDLREKAVALAHRFIITDGHVDLPYRMTVKNFRLTREFLGIPVQSDQGDFDFVRARRGGLDAPFMSIYIPSAYQETDGGKALADSLITLVREIAAAHPDKFGLANSPGGVEANFQKGIISLPMGMENGAPVRELEDVDYFFQRGIRYITLTHAKDNQICDSSYDTTHTHNGLSEFGRSVVREMNRVGIMVDISHVSDSTFYQVMRLSKAPCIASHSSCRYYTPGWERNMSDDMIRELGRRGGVIQINFGSTFLDSNTKKRRNELREEMREMLGENGLKESDEAAEPLIKKWKEQHREELYSDVEMVANHIDRVVMLAGIDHVGFGSDFDGVGDSLPTGLKDVSMYPNLIRVLLERGYSEADIEKICYKNVFRVWRAVAAVAAQMQQAD